MNDIVDIRAKLRELDQTESERRKRRIRQLVDAFIAGQGEVIRETDRFVNGLLLGWLSAFLLFVLPDIWSWWLGLAPVLVVR